MPKGFKTPPEKADQAVALANTGTTDEQITKILELSRRQLGRIWKEKGVKRNKQNGAPGRKVITVIQTAKPEFLTGPVAELRQKEHSNYLRKQLQHLIASIKVPKPENVFIWPGQTELAVSTLSEQSHLQGLSLKLTVTNEKVEVKLAMETTEDWYFLEEHLSSEKNPPAADDYAQWKVDISQYLTTCYKMLAKVVEESNRQINELMSCSRNWQGVIIVDFQRLDPGIYRCFYDDVYSLGLGWPLWDHETTKLTGDKPGLVYLCRAARSLALGTDDAIEIIDRVHKYMRVQILGWPEVKELKVKYEHCAAGAKALRSKLAIIEKRGDFQGECDICRPWHVS